MGSWFSSACLAVAAAALLGGCDRCERETDADGRYTFVSDCAPTGLARGTVAIGAFGNPVREGQPISGGCSVESSDAGVHGSGEVSPDGGVSDTRCAVEAPEDEEETCAATSASGAAPLGLPSGVRVRGERDFELFGEVNGRMLECEPEPFGDERLMFCRSSGRVVCVAAIEEE